MDNLDSRMKGLQKKIDQQESACSKMNEKLSDQIKKNQKDTIDTQKDIKIKMEGRFDNLKSDIRELGGSIEMLKTGFEKKIESLENKIDKKIENLEKNQEKNYKDLQNRISAMESKITENLSNVMKEKLGNLMEEKLSNVYESFFKAMEDREKGIRKSRYEFRGEGVEKSQLPKEEEKIENLSDPEENI